MSNYVIKKVNEEGHDRFLLWLSFESLLDHLSDIESSLNEINTSGRVLIDQLFLTGNGYNRFMSCDFTNGKLNLATACIVNPAEFFRKETVQWLHDNYDYVENSILTETQRQQIKNDIAF